MIPSPTVPHRRSVTARRPLALLALLTLLAVPAVATGGELPDTGDPIAARMMQVVGQAVQQDAARLFGTGSTQYCVTTDLLAACIHPDTPPERVDEILRNLPTWIPGGDRYSIGGRWDETAIDGETGNNGRPINLTYSFLDDGVWIPGADEPGSGSRLYQEMNGHFGSEDVWKAMFAEMFDDWGKHIGVTYEEVPDDGAAFPLSPGELGARGDVRIGAHPIDGAYGVLAYNYYPDIGDMVLDTSDNWGAPYNDHVFMRNICRHEHGHGLGLGHVSPENCQKLMEAYICTNFDGPQDDDIRGAMRLYGDTYEQNNNAGAATDLGLLEGPFALENPVSLTTSVDFDYYRFTTAGPSELDVTIDPVGSYYDLEGVMVQTDEVMDLGFRILGGDGGSDILIEVDATGEGQDEVLTDFVLPAAGDYWVLVFRTGGTPDVQRYGLVLDVALTDITAIGDGVPVADLGLGLFPNPFNPRTEARYYAAEPGPVALDVFNVAGQRVATVRDHVANVGWHHVTWDGRTARGESAPSGTYIFRLTAGGRTETARALLLE
ncbi:matrixin family metalloprotease [bacterium]|nr:matrixin family metalloprotease [bacterium]